MPLGDICALQVKAEEVSAWQSHRSEVRAGCGEGMQEEQVSLKSTSVAVWEFRLAPPDLWIFQRDWESRFLY